LVFIPYRSAGAGVRLLSAVAFAVPRSPAPAPPPASLFRDTVAPATVEGQNLYRAISAAAACVAALTLVVALTHFAATWWGDGRLALLRLLAEGLRRERAKFRAPNRRWCDWPSIWCGRARHRRVCPRWDWA
jgi:hypothetical protein